MGIALKLFYLERDKKPVQTFLDEKAGFPGGSHGKETAYSAGDLGLISVFDLWKIL